MIGLFDASYILNETALKTENGLAWLRSGGFAQLERIYHKCGTKLPVLGLRVAPAPALAQPTAEQTWLETQLGATARSQPGATAAPPVVQSPRRHWER